MIKIYKIAIFFCITIGGCIVCASEATTPSKVTSAPQKSNLSEDSSPMEESFIDTRGAELPTIKREGRGRIDIQSILQETESVNETSDDPNAQETDVNRLNQKERTNVKSMLRGLKDQFRRAGNADNDDRPLKIESDQEETKSSSENAVKSVENTDVERSNNAKSDIDNVVQKNVITIEPTKSARQEVEKQTAVNTDPPKPAKTQLFPGNKEFIENELMMSVVPNDDIVLGEVTKESKISSMDSAEYVKLFWVRYNDHYGENNKRSVDSFLKDYKNKFHKIRVGNVANYDNYFSLGKLRCSIVDAVKRDDISSVKTLLDYYPNLVRTVDYNDVGNSLLHIACKYNSYRTARLLVTKGTNLYYQNMLGQQALDFVNDKKIAAIFSAASKKSR